MKSISARQFRSSFASLTEPVTVLRRDGAGNFQVLGEWHPYMQTGVLGATGPLGLVASEPVPVPAGPSFGTSKPAPKIRGKS